MIDSQKRNWENMKIAILGASKTGLAASKLAKHIGAKVFVSDLNSNINLNQFKGVEIELGEHSNKVLESDLIIKSPGIPNEISILKKALSKNINIVSEILL